MTADLEPVTYDRTPPQAVEAEQSVLGAMLISKDAIGDVTEILGGRDFYRPAHELIFNAALDLYTRGEPADAVTVGAELTKRGEIGRAGGLPYLHTLISSVPTAANAGYYARIVVDKGLRRRLVEAGTRIVQIGYQEAGETFEAVNEAEAELYGVAHKRQSEDYMPLSATLPAALDEIELVGNNSGELRGIPTGFIDLDRLTNGLQAGQLIVVAGRPAMGKALALDTPLPTPTGWTTMGEVQPGDFLLGADGKPTRVVAATDVMHGRPCYEVIFNDGTSIVADAQHEWLTSTRAERRNLGIDVSVKTTVEIAATVRCVTADGRLNHAVRLPCAAELPDVDLPFPPYALGVWLGDGESNGNRFTTADPEIIANVEADGLVVTKVSGKYHHGTVKGILRTLGVVGNKHIPAAYLRASESQRRALLAGLLDTSGYCQPTGPVQFAVTSARLAYDTEELALSLGYRTTVNTKRVRGRSEDSSTCYTVSFTPADKVFRLTRKLARQTTREHPTTRCRFIREVQPVPSVPVRCVQVDNADHLYLASRAWIPTHNSTIALDFARSCSIARGLPSVIFSLEMGKIEITMRLLSAEARVALHHMRSGSTSSDDWARLAMTMSRINDKPLYIDDSPNLSLMEIRAKGRRLKQQHGLSLLVVDYLQLMQRGGTSRPESRQQEVSEISRGLKLLAKELEVPIVAASQLNRGPEQRTDKRPHLSDLRESGAIEQDADMVILLHREDVYERDSPRSGEADLIVAKHRNGPVGDVTVAFQGHYSRFVDMAPELGS